MQRPSDKKSPGITGGFLFCGKLKLTILLPLLSAALLTAALLTALSAALASGLLILLAGFLLAAMLAAMSAALVLPALLNVSHFLVRHGGVLLRGPIPRDNNLSGPSLVQL